MDMDEARNVVERAKEKLQELKSLIEEKEAEVMALKARFIMLGALTQEAESLQEMKRVLEQLKS